MHVYRAPKATPQATQHSDIVCEDCPGNCNVIPCPAKPLYRYERIVELDQRGTNTTAGDSDNRLPDYVFIRVNGLQPFGKKYRVTVEEMP